ncbi:sugar kinase [Nocardia seriolae]|uniref:sugar kinase n=1 Tax=Nocardia seriolae TaxID=37332 RepID=UPI00090B68C4|nr:sugar kinase [Nocardia seriolae]WKY50209.1 sugar kinase [Nocardia seriolae]BAW05972.1 sugar kinase [Nocardia seriolae]BEK87294.1 sugar kinase [Nocardia seriolae]GEM24568.1 sugar kinase [Nocardia seriolae NBRC 15557]
MIQPTARAVTVGEGLAVLIAAPGPLEDSPVFDRGAGGAEANVACVLSQLGIPTGWLSRVGDDGFGRYLVRQLTARGVDTSAVTTDATRPTGVYVKERGGGSDRPTDLAAGSSRMLYYRTGSAASALSPADLRSARALLEAAELIHFTGITTALSPTATELTDALLTLPRRGRLISFDLNYRPALWARRTEFAPDILARHIAGSDVVFLGADEAEEVFGIDDADRLRLAFPQPRHLIVKNDKHSVTGFLGADRLEVPALTLEVTERIGAGDAFAGGYLAALLQRRPHEPLLRFGHLCAAAALTGTGDIADLPPLPALESLAAATASEWAALHYRPGVPVPENVAP